MAKIVRLAAQGAIRGYQLSLSALIGRQCRHWPSCSDYASQAIGRHGLWPGGWMGVARICRCGPFGTAGVDLVCEEVPPSGRWYAPWLYARWRGTNDPGVTDASAANGPIRGSSPSPRYRGPGRSRR